MFGNTIPMDQGEDVEGPIYEKTFKMEIQWNVKLMFSITPPSQGVWAQFA